ncbi:hypothetical protein BDV09DRAFT_66652 [Aspergillus tetrazonus]|uniref:SWIRM domain-containing protein n=1 Tax=Aspergillus foveolatus TaxID=210207 RepID=UPI003CCD3D99
MTSFPTASLLASSHKPSMGRLPSVSSLMSPPESKPFESFNSTFPPHKLSQDQSHSQEMKLAPISVNRKRTQLEMELPSPPVTPYVGNNKKSKSTDPEQPDGDVLVSSRDPVLFSTHEPVPEIASYEPLIAPLLPPSPEAVMEQHIDSHMAMFDNKLNKPTRDEYFLALSCVPIVSAQYNRNPAAWAKEERHTLERQLIMMNRHRPEVSNGRLKRIAPAPTKRVVPAQSRVQRTPRVKRTPKSTPKQKVLDSFDVHTPNSKPSRAIGTSRDDTDFSSIKDYSPSLETLGGNAKALKADWKGQMLDLSNDPDRHLLSPAELNLAATLRLSCATYLCSKRRIFEARVKALRVGKEFRKTDAQQACKIDVNKASKLWTAYERVGLFNPSHFQEYLK